MVFAENLYYMLFLHHNFYKQNEDLSARTDCNQLIIENYSHGLNPLNYKTRSDLPIPSLQQLDR